MTWQEFTTEVHKHWGPGLYEKIYEKSIVVQHKVVVEFKAVAQREAIHKAQLLTYMKLTKCRVGLLINFNVPTLKPGLKRMVL